VGTKESVARPADAMDEERSVIIAGFGRFGNIVGRLLRANGVRPTVLDNDSDRVDVLRKLGLEVFYGDATRLDLLHAAGAGEAHLMVVALESSEQNLELVETARKHFPQLKLLVRADDRFDAYRLLDEDIEHVYRETLDTALTAGVDALCHLGFRRFQATRSANKFRCHDEAALRELAEMRHDRKQYMNHARERIRFLEETLQAEHEDTGERDAGWDVESLRKEYGDE
jgi:voltage-gated potassium channel Kch